MIQQRLTARDGFTLPELLIYIGISAILLVALANFFALLLSAQARDRNVADVQEEGTASMEIMTQTIRNATGIVSPATGTTASGLTLAGTTSTAFNVAGGVLEIIEASNAPIPLTSPRLFASGVSFSNLSASGTNGIIRIMFTLGHIKSGATSTVDYSQTFIDSAALRP
jgi:Tfp pilus assembly protein PilW